MMGDFVAYPSRWRVSLLALLSVGGVVMGLWMIGIFGAPPQSIRYPSGFTVAIGWICAVFFSLCGVLWIKKLFDISEQLQIGSIGIHSARWSDQTIPWAEITDVTTWRYKGQKVIVLHLRNPAAFPSRGLRAILAGTNRMLSGGDVCISLTGTDRTYDEAMAAIARFRSSRSL